MLSGISNKESITCLLILCLEKSKSTKGVVIRFFLNSPLNEDQKLKYLKNPYLEM